MYFVYITKNKINDKMYIGITNGNDSSYLGSGVYLKKAIKKYGRENFYSSILEECETVEELEKRERYWISFFNSTKKGYNIATGGTYRRHVDSLTLSESLKSFWNNNDEARLKMSKIIYGTRREKNALIKRTDFISKKQSISKSGDKNPMFGKSGNESPTSIKFNSEEIDFIIKEFENMTLKQLLMAFNKRFDRNIKTVKSISRILKNKGV